MSAQRRLVVIAKQREFDEEKWKQLLMAMAYFLREKQQSQAATQRDRTTNAHTMS